MDVDGYAKPTLQLIVEELLRSGLEEVCIVANRDNVEPIRRHFRGLSDRERAGQFAGKAWAEPLSDALADMAARLSFVVQETQEGYGHAVYQTREWVGSEPFLLSLGDHVYFSDTDVPCARQVTTAYETHGTAITSVMLAPEADLYRYGTLGAVPLPGTQPSFTRSRLWSKSRRRTTPAHICECPACRTVSISFISAFMPSPLHL